MSLSSKVNFETYLAGTVIFQEGGTGTKFYILLQGETKVFFWTTGIGLFSCNIRSVLSFYPSNAYAHTEAVILLQFLLFTYFSFVVMITLPYNLCSATPFILLPLRCDMY